MTFKRSLEQYVVIASILVLFWLTFEPFAKAIALGLLLALVFTPAYNKLCTLLGGRRTLSALLSTLIFAAVVVLPFVSIAISIVKEIIALAQNIGTELQHFQFQESPVYAKFLQYVPIAEDDLKQKLISFVSSLGASAGSYLANAVSSLPLITIETLLFLLSFYYGLADGPRIVRFVDRVLPFNEAERIQLKEITTKTSRGVVVGSLLAGLVQGSVIALGYATLGVPGALFFGATTAICSLVPGLGSTPTGIGGAIWLYANHRSSAAIVMLGFFFIASAADNIVKPWALKGSMALHPLIGLISALGGLVTFGFVGIFLGPLFAALGVAVLQMIPRQESTSTLSLTAEVQK